MAIDGYVDGVTFRDSTFQRCANSFLMVTPDQGPIYHLSLINSHFLDLGNDSYYGIQLTDSGGRGCGDYLFSGNEYRPNNPNGNYAYSGIRTNCAPSSGHARTEVTGNTFDAVTHDCATFLAAPYFTNWHANTFLRGSPCGS
jgi:hypothetical protein